MTQNQFAKSLFLLLHGTHDHQVLHQVHKIPFTLVIKLKSIKHNKEASIYEVLGSIKIDGLSLNIKILLPPQAQCLFQPGYINRLLLFTNLLLLDSNLFLAQTHSQCHLITSDYYHTHYGSVTTSGVGLMPLPTCPFSCTLPTKLVKNGKVLGDLQNIIKPKQCFQVAGYLLSIYHGPTITLRLLDITMRHCFYVDVTVDRSIKEQFLRLAIPYCLIHLDQAELYVIFCFPLIDQELSRALLLA